MTTIGMIYDFINSIAPFETQMGFDNAGLLIGSRDRQVLRAMVALDATSVVAEQAAANSCQLLITHHPVIFRPAKSIAAESAVYKLISSGVNVISAHTNYDIAQDGVNCCLAGALGLSGFSRPEWLECGVTGELPREMSAAQLGQLVADRLGADGVRVTDGGKPIRRAAIIGGSGGSDIYSLMGKVDALITGEASHHELLDARENGMTLIVAGHYETESVAMPPLADRLARQFPGVQFFLAGELNPASVIHCSRAAHDIPGASDREPAMSQADRRKQSYPKPPADK